MQMFQVTYTKEVILSSTEQPLDIHGFRYHGVKLDDAECVFDASNTPILSYGLMLPNLWNNEEGVQFCLIDKDWQFVDIDNNWTYLGEVT